MHFATVHSVLLTVNAFIEDTCVIVVIAYLLTRGRLFTLIVATRRTLREILVLGAILGVIGMTEDIFPGARFPYVTETLVLTFATMMGGLPVGGIAAMLACASDFAFQPLWQAGASVPVAIACLFLVEASRRMRRSNARESRLRLFFFSVTIGMLSQAIAVALRAESAALTLHRFSWPHALPSIPANGVGLFLLGLIVDEARIRRNSELHRRASEQHRLEAERAYAEIGQARAMLAESQLIAVRARLHPHFLFNSLSSIAALCTIAPASAESAIIRLGGLMRRVLEADAKAAVLLADELQDARDYMDVQQMRLGSRLSVVWNVDLTLEAITLVPPFSVLTLLENAVNHGVGGKRGPGAVAVIARAIRFGDEPYILVSVCDRGSGMTRAECKAALNPTDSRAHGLPLLAEQLRLLYGKRGRLRLFSRPDEGTICVFCVPQNPGRNLVPSKEPLG